MVQTAPEEAYRKFDDLSKKHIDALRALTKNIQDARLQRDNELIKSSLKRASDHDDAPPPSALCRPGRGGCNALRATAQHAGNAT